MSFDIKPNRIDSQDEIVALIEANIPVTPSATPSVLGTVYGQTPDFTFPHNLSFGYDSLKFNGGSINTAIGGKSQENTTSGSYNTSLGFYTLNSNFGDANTAVGTYALQSNLGGYQNTSIGQSSLQFNTFGYQNTSIGARSLNSNTNGILNTAVGYASLQSNTTGVSNIAVGRSSLSSNTVGSDNTALGTNSLTYNITGNNNTALGSSSLFVNTGSNNAALGYNTLRFTSGNQNTAIGSSAGENLSSGTNNILLGYNAQASSSLVSNEVVIGNSSVNRFRIPGLGIDWTSSNLPGAKSYSLISTVSLSGSSEVTVSGLQSYSSIFVAIAYASMQSATNLWFKSLPVGNIIWSSNTFTNNSSWSYQNMEGGLSAPGNNTDIPIGSTASEGGSISASLMIDGVSSNGGKYFSWQSGGYVYNGSSVDAGTRAHSGQGIYLLQSQITGISVAANSQFDGGTMYVYGSLK